MAIICDPEFDLVANLVAIETSRNGAMFSLHILRIVTIFLGIVTVNLALVGIGAIANESAGLISCYTISYVVLFVVFEALSLSSLQLQTTILPVIADQADMYCNATLMPTLSAELGCSDALPEDVPSCGTECHDLASDLRAYGGCELLTDLCHDMIYLDVGVGFCQIAANANGTFVRPRMWVLDGVNTDAAGSCQSKCSDTIDCIGFTYSEGAKVCMYVLPFGPTSDENWQLVDGARVPDEWQYMTADQEAGHECQVKDHPNIADEAQRIFAFAYAMFALIAAVLIAAAMCGCAQQYTLVTGRQGKKGLMPLAGKLLCPCFERQRRRKFVNEEDDEEAELVDYS